MTREEEIKRVAAIEKIYVDGDPEPVDTLVSRAGFIAGAKWADKHPQGGSSEIPNNLSEKPTSSKKGGRQ